MKRWGLDILILVLELGLVPLAAFTDFFERAFGSDWASKLIAIQVGLFLVWLPVRIAMSLAEHKEANQSIVSKVDDYLRTQRALLPIDDETFYSRFMAAIRVARRTVSITHLDVHPPRLLAGTEAKKYYGSFFKLIRERDNIDFERVERASAEKRPWLKKLIKELGTCKNFSLYCVIEPGNGRSARVSVQLIDDYTTVLVAVAAHYGGARPRDLWIQDASANEMFRTYYEAALRSVSLPVIQNGRVNADALKQLQEHIGKF